MNLFKTTGKFLIAVLGLTLALHAIIDVFDFHRIQKGTYQTPWYDARWWRSPYTSFRVSIANSEERWTKNAVGDDWYVRETKINGKEWWTILKVSPRSNIQP